MTSFLTPLKNRDFLINKYNHLLYVLLLSILIYPFTIKERTYLPLYSVIIFLSIIPALRASISPKFFRRILCFPIISLLIDFFIKRKILPDTELLHVLSKGIDSIFFLICIICLIRKILSVKTVDSDIIKGGICIYLLIGLLWSLFYVLVYELDPTAFKPSHEPINFVYFSYLTLTTVGYGDITPVNEFARTLTNLEAITGQLYLAILISQLVGIRIAQQARETNS